MYRKKDDLLKLINALSLSEKRHFMILSRAFNPSRQEINYVQIFQSINKKSDASDLKNMSNREQTTARRRLYNNILKSLLLYHQDKSIDITIQNLIGQIEILHNLSLPEQSEYLLSKAYKLAARHEKWSLIIQLLEWERKINVILKAPSRTIDEITKEEKNVLIHLNQLLELQTIYSKIRDLKKQIGYVNEKTKKRLHSILKEMPDLKECSSHKAQHYFHFIYSLYYTITFDHMRAYLHGKHLANAQPLPVSPADYIDGLLQHVTACICFGRFAEAIGAIEQSEHSIHRRNKDAISKSYEIKTTYYKISCHLIIYNYMGETGALSHAVQEAEQTLQQLDQQLTAEMKQVIAANLRNAYIGIGEFHHADEITNQLLKKEAKSVRKSIYDDSYLFRLFSSLQTQTYSLLPSLSLSSYRYFKNQKTGRNLFDVEIKISELLTKEYDYDRISVTQGLLQQIKELLAAHVTTLSQSNGFQEVYSFYLIWIESIINNTPFHEEARIWYKQYKMPST